MRYSLSEIDAIIKDRRSIFPKDHTERKVQADIVERLLDNARWAPSHHLTQPWRFKVFMDENKGRLEEKLPEIYRETTPPEAIKEGKAEKIKEKVANSSVVIAICMARDPDERLPELEEIEAVACAVQNMYLTATAYGLAAYWSTGDLVYTEAMKSFLGLAEKDRCLGLFYVGYPAIDWPKGQRKPLEYFVDWDPCNPDGT
ncbi:MAG: nitroreductase [Flavobacteriales bacterium]